MDGATPNLNDLDEYTGKRWYNSMKGLRNGTYSDFIIKCGRDTHAVHKLIISEQSDVLSRACNGLFKEATDGVLELVDDDPLAVTAMIDYIYLGNYTQTIMVTPGEPDKPQHFSMDYLPLHAKAYIIGDKYGLEGLRVTATSNTARTVDGDSDCVLSPKFREAIDIIYDHAILEATIDFRACLIKSMVDHPSCLNDKATEATIRLHSELAYDIGIELRRRSNLEGFRLRCNVCGQTCLISIINPKPRVIEEDCPAITHSWGHTSNDDWDEPSPHAWRSLGREQYLDW